MSRTDAAARGPHATPWSVVRRAGRGIRWYITELMGDGAYRVYLEHHSLRHPGEDPLSERVFWRERMDAQDRNPGARCC